MDREVADTNVAAIALDGAGLVRAPGAVAGIERASHRGSAARNARDSIFRRSLFVADAVAILGAFVLASEMSSRALHLTWATIVGLAIMLTGAKVLGLYDRDEVLLHRSTLDEAPKLFHLATLCALVAWLAGGLVLAGRLDRQGTLLMWVSVFVLLALSRSLARAVALRLAPPERCLFIGNAAGAKAVARGLEDRRGVRAELVGHIELASIDAWSSDARNPAKLAKVRELARGLDVHRAIVAPESAGADEVLDLLRTLNAIGVPVSILPRVLEVVGSSVEFDDVRGMTLMGVRRFQLTRSSLAVKRAFDMLCASLALLATAPLMIAIAIAIKLDSRGPVFFRQQRVGRRGARFQILKFRTMVAGAEAMKDSLREYNEAEGGLFKIADDPRITRVGRLLRRSALDELPQLLNILQGEMSIVGPRPLVVDEDAQVSGWHRRRLALTPGMTGPWQILGPARVPLAEMVAIDYMYVANWSLWSDVKILIRTVDYVLGRRGL